MKIYVVEESTYDGNYTRRIFINKDLADKYAATNEYYRVYETETADELDCEEFKYIQFCIELFDNDDVEYDFETITTTTLDTSKDQIEYIYYDKYSSFYMLTGNIIVYNENILDESNKINIESMIDVIIDKINLFRKSGYTIKEIDEWLKAVDFKMLQGVK